MRKWYFFLKTFSEEKWLYNWENSFGQMYSKEPCRITCTAFLTSTIIDEKTWVQRNKLTRLWWQLQSSRGEYSKSGLFGPNAQNLSFFFFKSLYHSIMPSKKRGLFTFMSSDVPSTVVWKWVDWASPPLEKGISNDVRNIC